MSGYAFHELEETFFKAMREGYASDAVKKGTAEIARRITIVGLSGYKGIEWEDGPWRVVDLWIVEQCPETPAMINSGGSTTIWHEGIPVFVMHYGGAYTKDVIPFLKEALMVNYQASCFVGGRGPFSFQKGNLLYLNSPTHREFPDFMDESFRGREKILEFGQGNEPFKGVLRGWHEYWGILL